MIDDRRTRGFRDRGGERGPTPIGGDSNSSGRLPPGAGSYPVSIALYLILTFVSCGLFNVYWNYRQMGTCNEFLGRLEFSFGWWVVLCLLTCGLYHFYYQYKMGAAINEIQLIEELPITEGLPMLSLVAAILGFGVVADCIHQYELNKLELEY